MMILQKKKKKLKKRTKKSLSISMIISLRKGKKKKGYSLLQMGNAPHPRSLPYPCFGHNWKTICKWVAQVLFFFFFCNESL
jgi:hypothetical protein